MGFHNIKKIGKGKKDYNCLICGGKIITGDSYYSHAGKHDYGFYDYKTCERCDTLLGSEIGNLLKNDKNCVGEYSLVENLVMGGAIVCENCNSQDCFNWNYKDKRRLSVEMNCENCENSWIEILDLEHLKGKC